VAASPFGWVHLLYGSTYYTENPTSVVQRNILCGKTTKWIVKPSFLWAKKHHVDGQNGHFDWQQHESRSSSFPG
jgi:hypothetical protein